MSGSENQLPRKRKGSPSPLILTCLLTLLAGDELHCLAADRSLKLVEEGQPRVTILIPSSAAPAPKLAALELQYCVEKISGAKLPIRVLNRPFSGVRMQLDGAEFAENQATPETLNLRRYEYVIDCSPAGVVLLGQDARDTTGAEINYAAATGQGADPAIVKLPGMFDDQGTLRAAYDFLERFCGVLFLWAQGGLGRFSGPPDARDSAGKHPT